MSNDAESEDVARIRKALNELSEHFDAVQIFATRHESGESDGTINVQIGTGNWFARYGHIHTWLLKADEDSREQARRDMSDS